MGIERTPAVQALPHAAVPNVPPAIDTLQIQHCETDTSNSQKRAASSIFKSKLGDSTHYQDCIEEVGWGWLHFITVRSKGCSKYRCL